MEQGKLREFSFSEIRVHPDLITDLLDKGSDVELMLRREGDRVTVHSRQTNGKITLEELMENTISVLRHFTENADSIVSELKPARASGLLEVMNRLAKRLDEVRDESDLLTVANVVYDLTVEIPFFPPDTNPPDYFLPEDLKSCPEHEGRERIGRHKFALREVFDPCWKRIEQAWWDKPSIIPETVSKGSEEPPWDMMGMFKDDPTWGEMFDEIERERDRWKI